MEWWKNAQCSGKCSGLRRMHWLPQALRRREMEGGTPVTLGATVAGTWEDSFPMPMTSQLPLLRSRLKSALSPPCCTVIVLILPVFNFSLWTKIFLQKFLSAAKKEQCLAQSLCSAVKSLQLQHQKKPNQKPKKNKHQNTRNKNRAKILFQFLWGSSLQLFFIQG